MTFLVVYLAGLMTGISSTILFLLFLAPQKYRSDEWIVWIDLDRCLENFQKAKEYNASEIEYRNSGYKNNNREKSNITIHFISAENQVSNLLK
jgi:hypothetical protein